MEQGGTQRLESCLGEPVDRVHVPTCVAPTPAAVFAGFKARALSRKPTQAVTGRQRRALHRSVCGIFCQVCGGKFTHTCGFTWPELFGRCRSL